MGKIQMMVKFLLYPFDQLTLRFGQQDFSVDADVEEVVGITAMLAQPLKRGFQVWLDAVH